MPAFAVCLSMAFGLGIRAQTNQQSERVDKSEFHFQLDKKGNGDGFVIQNEKTKSGEKVLEQSVKQTLDQHSIANLKIITSTEFNVLNEDEKQRVLQNPSRYYVSEKPAKEAISDLLNEKLEENKKAPPK